jgi:PIN domain nuclease of toxin-antitoxin system
MPCKRLCRVHGMTLLLDTHAFLWFWWADPKLSVRAMEVICEPANRKLICRFTIKIRLTGC